MSTLVIRTFCLCLLFVSFFTISGCDQTLQVHSDVIKSDSSLNIEVNNSNIKMLSPTYAGEIRVSFKTHSGAPTNGSITIDQHLLSGTGSVCVDFPNAGDECGIQTWGKGYHTVSDGNTQIQKYLCRDTGGGDQDWELVYIPNTTGGAGVLYTETSGKLWADNPFQCPNDGEPIDDEGILPAPPSASLSAQCLASGQYLDPYDGNTMYTSYSCTASVQNMPNATFTWHLNNGTNINTGTSPSYDGSSENNYANMPDLVTAVSGTSVKTYIITY